MTPGDSRAAAAGGGSQIYVSGLWENSKVFQSWPGSIWGCLRPSCRPLGSSSEASSAVLGILENSERSMYVLLLPAGAILVYHEHQPIQKQSPGELTRSGMCSSMWPRSDPHPPYRRSNRRCGEKRGHVDKEGGRSKREEGGQEEEETCYGVMLSGLLARALCHLCVHIRRPVVPCCKDV